jgi:ppGpp synthetase/RelA/SpoT-type nucleotidyltranferase
MEFQQYKESKRQLYERFAKAVGRIIEAAISVDFYTYHLQQIQTRAKNIDSLKKKLEKKEIDLSSDIDEKITDLAGCRLIFYYNADARNFIRSGIVSDNFEVDWKQSPVHHPGKDALIADDQYRAQHYIVSLKAERATLPDFRDYQGLKCEIQIQTALNHAWSETAHNIIHKPEVTEGFGGKALGDIKRRLNKVMTDYLLPAGYQFQNIENDYQRLLAGKELFDRGVLDEVRCAENNNELQEILERFNEHVLANYDDISSEAEGIFELIETALSRAPALGIVNIESDYGDLEGKTPSDILEVSLKTLNRIRYLDIERSFETLVNLHTGWTEEADKKKISEVVDNLAAYDLDVWKKAGAEIQVRLISALEKLPSDFQLSEREFLQGFLERFLSPTMEGTSSDYQTVTWSRASVPATDAIKDVRRRSLQLLKGLYGAATTMAEKMAVINAMLGATRQPSAESYSDNVLDMVSEDTLVVLAFFKKILPDENLQIVQKIEHDAFWRFRHAPSDEVKASALEIRDILANHDEYAIYKNLIGFEGVFEDWEESLTKDPDFSGIDDYRSAKAKEYGDSINPENWDEWCDRILRFTTTESDDMATFPKFYEFLRRFAEKSPDLAFCLLTENLDDIRFFTIPLLRGLWKGPRKADLRALMLEWIAVDRQLRAVTKLFLSNEDIDEELLQILLDKGTKDANRDILNLIVAVVASNHTDGHEDLVLKFFLPTVKSLTRLEDSGWVNQLWHRKERKNILHSLGEDGREIILEGLLVADDIDYHAEELLIPLAEDNPGRIIAFFGERLRYKEEAETKGHYDAIPYQFHKLHETLAKSPEIAVDIVRSWFDGKDASFQFYGANLLSIIFPAWAEPYGDKLLDLARTGETQDIKFVLHVLQNYEGEAFLHGICREIVSILPENDDLLTDVSVVLGSTGVVMGEFGFAEAYEGKIEEIKPWLNDGNEKVRKFAAEYVRGLENRAKSERRRAEEDIELRKHEYGVREEEADEDGGEE